MTVKISTRALKKVADEAFDVTAKKVVARAERVGRRIAPVDTGAYRKSFVSKRCSDKLWTFGNSQEYALFLEEGVKTYVYNGGAGAVVRFRDGGFRFLRSRKGFSGRKVLQKAVDRAIGEIL